MPGLTQSASQSKDTAIDTRQLERNTTKTIICCMMNFETEPTMQLLARLSCSKSTSREQWCGVSLVERDQSTQMGQGYCTLTADLGEQKVPEVHLKHLTAPQCQALSNISHCS